MKLFGLIMQQKFEPPAGLEPAIPGLGGRCLIHWATEATYLASVKDLNNLKPLKTTE